MEKEEIITISELRKRMANGEKFEVSSPDGYVSVTNFFDKGIKSTYTVLLLGTDISIKAVTLDHKIFTNHGWVEVQFLTNKHKVLTEQGWFNFKCYFFHSNQEVYDLSVDHPNHRFYADGVTVHNCIQHLFYYNIFNTSHVLLVGDLVQEIYQFRHSDSRYLEEENLLKAFNEVTTYHLTYNFRSAHPIVTLGNMLRDYAKSEIIQKPADITKKLPKRVFIQKVKNQVAEGKTIANHIKELIGNGAEPQDIAVITRTNKYITTILEPALIETGLPYIIQGSKTRKLTDKSEILYIVHCFQLMVASPKAQIFILKQMIENIQNIGPATARKLLDNLNGNIWNIINYNDKKSESLSVLIKFIQDCSFNGLDVSKIGYYIDTFLEYSKFDLKQQYIAEIKQLFSNWAEIYIEDTGKTLEQIIPEIQTSLDSVEEENVNAVKLASCHSQKGLEHRHVICSGFTYKSQKLAKPTVEELNIMYVAFSRAIESLLVVHSDKITYMGEEITGHKQKWLKKLLQDLEN